MPPLHVDSQSGVAGASEHAWFTTQHFHRKTTVSLFAVGHPSRSGSASGGEERTTQTAGKAFRGHAETAI